MKKEEKSNRRKIWTIWTFYILIGFEIIYMISPFGIYYYTIYGKGLNLLNENPATAWLSSFFLPHIVETSSPILNAYKDLGWGLAILGFLAFCIGAGQIYYYKLAKKGTVKGGIYKFIRHPQYVSLAICSFGLLLVWPRYLVLVMFVTMLFAYYLLAKLEEKECEEKFGKTYKKYMASTDMFLPGIKTLANRLPRISASRIKEYTMIFILYILALSSSIVLANEAKSYSSEKIYSIYGNDSATISLTAMDQEQLSKILDIALSEDEIQKIIEDAKNGTYIKFLNYVLPSEWYFSDIPMNIPENIEGHNQPENYDENLYKIVITKTEVKKHSQGNRLILDTIKRYPLIEVNIDLKQGKVINIQTLPKTVRWGNIPTPIY